MKSLVCHMGGVLLTLLLTVTVLMPGAGAAAVQEPVIEGTHAVVMDYQTGEVYYAKNADEARPVASMTKVMSAYLVFDEISAGRLTRYSYITASSRAAAVSWNPLYSGLEHLTAGGRYTVDTLLKLIFTESCNGSVIALAEHIGGGSEEVFVSRMNARAAEWGIDAHFADSTGFLDKGNAVTPRAMAYIARRCIQDHPEILEYSGLIRFDFNGKTFWNTNGMLRRGSCEGIDGLKTGTTYGAGHCFTGTAQRDGHRIISVVMNSSSLVSRMQDSKKLLEYGFQCRAQREREWRQLKSTLAVDMRPRADTVLWTHMENPVVTTLSGIPRAIPQCDVFWELNGRTIGSRQTGVVLQNGLTSEINLNPAVLGETLRLTMAVQLPDGQIVRRTVPMKVSDQNMKIDGHMYIDRLEVYDDMPSFISVPVQVSAVQGLDLTTVGEWYMDGAPIPGFRNNTFHVNPRNRSAYFLFPARWPVGEHILEFRLNDAGMPGIVPASFSTEVVILSAEGADAADPAVTDGEVPAA